MTRHGSLAVNGLVPVRGAAAGEELEHVGGAAFERAKGGLVDFVRLVVAHHLALSRLGGLL